MDYKEKITHGKAGFPFSCYHLTQGHIRYRMPFHWHPEHEIVFVREGILDITLNESEYLMKAGDILFISGGTFHTGIPQDCIYECFVFNPGLMIPRDGAGRSLIESIEDGMVVVQPFFSGTEYNGLKNIVHQLSDAAYSVKEGYQFAVTGCILQFLGYIFMQELYSFRDVQSLKSSQYAYSLRNVLYFIETNYSRPVMLSELSEIAGMSSHYFCRYFKKFTRQTPVDYLISYRVNMAAYMLTTTEVPVTEIALGCGFNDVSHFIKTFKKARQTTPKQYRKTCQHAALSFQTT